MENRINVKKEVIGIVYRISKSTIFNISMLLLGFILGISAVKIHNHIEKHGSDNDEPCMTETE